MVSQIQIVSSEVMLMSYIILGTAVSAICTVRCEWGEHVTEHKFCCFGIRAACHCPIPAVVNDAVTSVVHDETITQINDTVSTLLGGVSGSNYTINFGVMPVQVHASMVRNFLHNYGPTVGFLVTTISLAIYASAVVLLLYLCYKFYTRFSPVQFCSMRVSKQTTMESDPMMNSVSLRTSTYVQQHALGDGSSPTQDLCIVESDPIAPPHRDNRKCEKHNRRNCTPCYKWSIKNPSE